MREIRQAGFINQNLLSTIFIGDKTGFIYVFNHGNYGKVRNYLNSVNVTDAMSIENWLANLLMDFEIDVFTGVSEIYMMAMGDLTGDGYEDLKNTLEYFKLCYQNASIGNEFLCIEFKIV